MVVVALAEMFGVASRLDELATVLTAFEGSAAAEPGCLRYTFAATVADPTRFILWSEWESAESLDAHYRSEGFASFQFDLDGLLARPSEMTVYSADGVARPLDTRPMDPRDAD